MGYVTLAALSIIIVNLAGTPVRLFNWYYNRRVGSPCILFANSISPTRGLVIEAYPGDGYLVLLDAGYCFIVETSQVKFN
jgi:hypothetical protein